MYPASADFLTKIKSNTRKISWRGTITTNGGSAYAFTSENIINGGNITRQISSQSLNIGTVFSASLSIELILPGVSRYELYGAEVVISCSVQGAPDVIPMGIFAISEVTQASDHITIKAYDNMLKFDDAVFNLYSNMAIRTPYQWLDDACNAAGVILGITAEQVGRLPNGNRKTGFADVVTDVKSWRDVLGYLGTYLGAYSYIGRDGKLYLENYGSIPVDTVPASFRYSSELSDFRTTYDGIYGIYKAEGVQEYVANGNSNGIVLDIGTNPFLQFTDQTNRLSALGEIIDIWSGIYYVPFSSDMPLIPIYDPGDVLTFIDNQAGQYDIGAITEITYEIGGQMHVSCSGDNPRLTSAQDRFSKTVSGLASEYSNGQEIGGKNFWMLHTTNTSDIELEDYSYTLVASIEWVQNVDVMQLGLMFDSEVSQTETGIVSIQITIDGEEPFDETSSFPKYEITEQKSMAGKRRMDANCGFRVTGKGKHVARVFMLYSEYSLRWNDLI